MIKISEAEKCTNEELLKRFVEYGFTKEDYKKTEKIENNKTILWICVPVAKHYGVKPYELLTKLFVGTIGKHLRF